MEESFDMGTNRAQRRAAQKNKPAGLIKMLQTAAENAKANQEQEQQQPEVKTEDLNQLPMPIKQVMEIDQIIWTWDLPKGFEVSAFLYRTGDKAGTYEIDCCFPFDDDSDQNEVYTATPEQAKLFGHALISASNWQNVWKQYVGEFIARDMEPTVTIQRTPIEVEMGPIGPAIIEKLDLDDAETRKVIDEQNDQQQP